MSDNNENVINETEEEEVFQDDVTWEDTVEETLHYLPEAGGVAFMELFTAKGAKINITARGFDTKSAIDNLMDAVVYGMTKYKLTTSLSLPQAPEYAPTIRDNSTTTSLPQPVHTAQPQQNNGTVNSYKVSAVFHDVDSKGTHHIKARCGRWVKFGLYAYEQLIPETVDFISWNMKTDYAPPPEMAIALVDESGEKPRIRGFKPE